MLLALHHSSFPSGNLPVGLYKQQVSCCERGQAPDSGCLPLSWALSLAWHQLAKSWLPVFLGLPAVCFEGKLLPTASLVLQWHAGQATDQQRTAKHECVQCSQEPVLQHRSSLCSSTELRLTQKDIILCNTQQAWTGYRWGATPSVGQSASQGHAVAQRDHVVHKSLDSTLKWSRVKRLTSF